MSLATPDTVRRLQEVLHEKAKRDPHSRFHQLADKLYRPDVLAQAYRKCRANGGAPGEDGATFASIEAAGLGEFLTGLAESLHSGAYRPDPVKRVWIAKANGKQRPLGIPTIRDRVVQAAVGLLLEPILEADLPDEQYAYRTGRSAADALNHVQRLLDAGYTDVVDADLSGYFDSIPHEELMRCLARRISDRQLLRLIKRWLQAPVVERDERGRARWSNPGRRTHRGSPQGAPLSPLLANLYLRRLMLAWRQLGYERRLDARIVSYADDFVICCRGAARARQALAAVRRLVAGLKLELNEEKTCLRHLPRDRFDFLGYTFGRFYSPRTGRAYLGLRPSAKSLNKVREKLHHLTRRRRTGCSREHLVRDLNRVLTGWRNYFSLGWVSRAYKTIDGYAAQRLRHWLQAKHRRHDGRWQQPAYLHEVLGLVQLQPGRQLASPFYVGSPG